MSRYYYDLHIHSCLSPCADDDMTPANIAGMASLQGLGLLALTDHNTSANCPAFFKHCRTYGIVPVAGMELTTAEEIHVICLFPTLESAMDFHNVVQQNRIRIPNKPSLFGNQFLMDENDEIVCEEPDLLINATQLDLETAYRLVSEKGGVCYPAHVDRDSGGCIAVLGDLPDSPPYTAYELNDRNSLDQYRERYPKLQNKQFLVSSDAHHLWNISEPVNAIDLQDEPYSSQIVRQALIDHLKGV